MVSTTFRAISLKTLVLAFLLVSPIFAVSSPPPQAVITKNGAAGGGGGGITNSAGSNVITKSDGTNVVASCLTDDGTTIISCEDVYVGSNSSGKNFKVLATFGANIAPALVTPNWTLPAGWSYGTGPDRLIRTASASTTATPASGATVTAGTWYKISITVSAWSAGNASVWLGGTQTATVLAAATTYTEYFKAVGTTALQIVPNASGAFTISDISYQAVTAGTGDTEIQGTLTVNNSVYSPGPYYVTYTPPNNNTPQYSSLGIPNGGISITNGRLNLITGGTAYAFLNTAGFVVAGNVSGTSLDSTNLALTTGTMTVNVDSGRQATATNSFFWGAAQVNALGAVLEGDITVATLPAKTEVLDAIVRITTPGAGTTTLTVSCGDAIGGTPFTNYILPANAQAAANTIYGDATAERGASLDGDPLVYLPSYTSTTVVTCHFISTGANLSAVTGSSGMVILTTRLLP